MILSGDVRQHSSPEFGDGLRLVIQKSNLNVAHIDTILRQRNQPKLKKAIEAMARGEVKKGFDKLDKMDAIIEIEDIHKRHEQIAKAYVLVLQAKRSVLVISPTHGEGQLITEAIRNRNENPWAYRYG